MSDASSTSLAPDLKHFNDFRITAKETNIMSCNLPGNDRCSLQRVAEVGRHHLKASLKAVEYYRYVVV